MTFQRQAVALDTNLLLLHLVSTNRLLTPLIESWKRLNTFDGGDAVRLSSLLSTYRQHVTTSHVLTETSNFVDHTPLNLRDLMLDSFYAYIHATVERTKAATELSSYTAFRQLGLADCALIDLPESCTVITVDFHLAASRQRVGASVLNFNHYRGT